MTIFVKANPSSKHAEIIKIGENEYTVSVKAPPVKGLANRAIIETLAEYFKTSPSKVRIISGYTSRNKTIEINL